MICIGRGELLDDPENSCYTTDQLWLKTAKQLNVARKKWYKNTISARQLVKYIGNAQTIAERVELFPIRPKISALPKFCDNQEQKLYDICMQHHRIGELLNSEEYIERFQYEMSVIRKLGYFDYFLIVWDIIEWAIANGIPHNVRGSVCGSLVAYFMNITWVDPIRFNLPFERFLNEDRLSMPDIDMDFGTTGRERIIEYTEEKYGKDCVVHICNFLRWKPKAAIKDVGRILNISFSELNGITSAMPEKDKIDEWDDLKKYPAVMDYLADKEELDEMSQKMLGLIRQQGVHASGVVITPGPCIEWLPVSYRVEKETNKTRKVTEWDMYALEDLGILKLDFLGVNQLDIMQKALELINSRHDVPFKKIGELYKHIDKFDDKKVYKLIADCKTAGTFQLGTSDGMRKLGADLKPDCIEEIFAMISLYRTALITDGLHNDFVNRKFGQNYNYEHPKMASVLDSTYGIMLYQEQCLTGDSLIQTPYGEFTISDICNNRSVDKVYCVDEETGEICIRNILDYHINGKKDVFELELDTGEKIKCTEDHKFFTKRGWIKAQHLLEDDDIITLRID
jgi:DNA polymerase-3 subunit alpha